MALFTAFVAALSSASLLVPGAGYVGAGRNISGCSSGAD
eukprot:CAMPEP_0195588580 /NCGR_PEP_ID=MMETSP0814-20130614/32926_1 /TAXON_ID=97485 /ORGANISM="Prymnesium parvum, Strain Texoma1" /LENGTH=38 /DNA_ID=CAMNT_0040727559 /DNA_START=560 /DNA_END=676 /DNA_ORIENTATION=+